jgi:phage terminase large subunit-like protein
MFEPTPTAATWSEIARPEQLPPPGDWQTWLILAGRGWGKTRTGGEYIADLARTYPGARIALVAATFADGRDTMVEGESGLLAILDDSELKGGSQDVAWNRSMGELFLKNGSRFKIYSSERPRQLRGPQHHFAWCDEAAAWLDSAKGTAKDTTWSNLLFGLRLPAQAGWQAGYRTRIVVTTTPRPVPLIKVPDSVVEREPHRAGIIQRPSTVTTRGKTSDNLSNLSEEFRKEVIDPIAGTSLARQELDAEILEDADGALLTREIIDRNRVRVGEVPTFSASVLAIDPATTVKAESDETGMVVVALGSDANGYVLDDKSGKYSPDEWGMLAWATALDHGVSAVIVEDNQGGDMCEHVLITTWAKASATYLQKHRRMPVRPPIERVHPSGPGQGKWVRALPVKALYEQNRIKHVTDPDLVDLSILEDQATAWTGDPKQDSPDRVDAEVHGLTWLMYPQQRAVKGKKKTTGHSGTRWVGMRGR